MIHWRLALKRALRPGALLMLAVIFVTLRLSGSLGAQTHLRPCGVVCEDPGAAEVAAALVQKEFVLYDNREAMAADVAQGKLNCGAVLLDGLGEAVEAGAPAGHVLLLTSPDAFLTEVYEAHIAATLYAASAPALTLQAAAEAGVALDPGDVRDSLAAYYDEGYRFTFAIETVEGAAAEAPDLGRSITRAAAALLLFAGILPGTLRICADSAAMSRRIGKRASAVTVLIPGLFWQTALYLAASGLAAAELLPALAPYILLLTLLGLVFALLHIPAGILLPIVLLGSLAMMPIYFDLAAVFPQLGILRWILPPCWLWMLAA